MCGIIGYIGKNKCLPILLEGLKKQEYRGYDSAGISYIENNQIKLVKTVNRIDELANKLDLNTNSYMGIGHTRWATHGMVNELNSHPHQSGKITIVHNGIIENYLELKEILENEGYYFQSDTDTEIACAYIDWEYKNNNNFLEVINKCSKKFVGSYAIVIIVNDIKDKLFVLKKDSPLLIAKGIDEYFVASDIGAFDKNYVTNYIILDDFDYGVVSKNEVLIYNNGTQIKKEDIMLNEDNNSNELNGYKHYMLKEINEQILLVDKWNLKYLNNLDSLPNLHKYNKIHIIGCGTAYHAGLVGKFLIENYANIEVEVYIASEYRYQKLFVDDNTLVIGVSQSGETADTLACIKKVKELGCKTLGIINAKNSAMCRLVDDVIYTEAGQEIAVASTKAYLSQIYIFSLLAFNMSNLNKELIFKEYNKLSSLIKKLINLNYANISNILSTKNNIFYLGRGIDYISMLEGALKLKEISYIHSYAIAAGELKHGTISLIENGTPVIGMITDKNIYNKTISNIKEVKSRGAYIILIVNSGIVNNIDTDCYDDMLIVDDVNEIVQPLINVIPLQLIAYYTALEKGCDIDKPRNLAKSVTVE